MGWIPMPAIINSARSRPTPSTFRAAILAALSGSARLTYTLVAVFKSGTERLDSCERPGRETDDRGILPLKISPVEPLTVTIRPSLRVFVATVVPTTHGTPNSRETIAAWDVRPPRLVIIAAARFIAGTKSGVVISVTIISPGLTLPKFLTSGTSLTGPEISPGEAGAPFKIGSPNFCESFLVICPSLTADGFPAEALPSVVIGRAWVI
ncbi:hypothetical protein A2395_01175 [Candidatus Amesbacteria bacterium RIFOXYB1_FULL_47_9]|uniref:Uncharacterized protein n=1 Tax=Candidatus Amesbacteria bacterium RIFOXYB1_FULL_47_9 TaxID=1797266 RepID=A0A1F4ZT79_9BACT|nr:MAG: hypothetical protein A2395_01175 [Candidatus Amesbacteria bacterium RIFOXYB1_FULL_47_9]